MRSTPGYPSESDLDRGCVFWMKCYAAELQEAVKQTTTIEQGKLAPEAVVMSSKLYHWMKQAMSGYKRGLDLAVLQEREQGGLTCGYELFRRINNLLGVTTRAEALSLREAVMRLDVNGLKQLGCPSAGSVKNPFGHLFCSLHRSLRACEISVQHSQISR